MKNNSEQASQTDKRHKRNILNSSVPLWTNISDPSGRHQELRGELRDAGQHAHFLRGDNDGEPATELERWWYVTAPRLCSLLLPEQGSTLYHETWWTFTCSFIISINNCRDLRVVHGRERIHPRVRHALGAGDQGEDPGGDTMVVPVSGLDPRCPPVVAYGVYLFKLG